MGMSEGPLLVVDNGTHYLSELRRALTLLEVPHRVHDSDRPLPAGERTAAAGIILTGGELHLYGRAAPAGAALNLELIEHATVPILGLCLGCQLIAWAYGAVIERLPAPVDCPADIEILSSDELFAGIPSPTPMVMAHNDAIVDVGVSLAVLARSEFGEFEAIRHRRRAQYGVQFHPEVSGEMGRRLLGNFAALCRADSGVPTVAV